MGSAMATVCLAGSLRVNLHQWNTLNKTWPKQEHNASSEYIMQFGSLTFELLELELCFGLFLMF